MTAGPVPIRPAQVPADIEAVRALLLEYARSLDFSLCFQGFDAELAALPGDYRQPRGALLVAHGSDVLAGCVAMRPLDRHVCEMKRLYVRPAPRATGLGRALAQAIMQAGRDAGYRAMGLDTVPSMAAARALYASLGFRPVTAYCPNPIPGTIWMEAPLTA